MSPLEITALAIGGTVGYVACAGLAWRLAKPSRFNPEALILLLPLAGWGGFVAGLIGREFDPSVVKTAAVLFWPLALPVYVLRAVFRLIACDDV